MALLAARVPAALAGAALLALMESAVPSGATAASSRPRFDPSSFTSRVDNPWFPLRPGRTLRYAGEEDGRRGHEVFHVTRRTKTILGVRATVIHDRVFLGGRLRENTRDYYAQDRRGNVWYLGEDTEELDAHGKVTTHEGTWRAGRQGARAGIFMPARPRVGQSFRQERFKGHAEDHFRIVSLHATVDVPAVSTTRAMRTREWSPLEPGVRDAKLYVRGIGTVLERTVRGSDERWALVAVRGPGQGGER
ncbi:MAG TPA: hypothetical protein VFT50_01330 [Baekduia sp.]|nr:hypothetical protein [Baekduia sp.]